MGIAISGQRSRWPVQHVPVDSAECVRAPAKAPLWKTIPSAQGSRTSWGGEPGERLGRRDLNKVVEYRRRKRGDWGADLSTRNRRIGALLGWFSTELSTERIWVRIVRTCLRTDVHGFRPWRDLHEPGGVCGRCPTECGWEMEKRWCRGPDSNWGHRPFQGRALPTELPRRTGGEERG